ncbi:MAG TPA: peptidylprolyl isomerase [Haliangium sp.]|nr:peptidylprolyl isomerase [Haliangium sp.]
MTTRALLLAIALLAPACGGQNDARVSQLHNRVTVLESDAERTSALETRIDELGARTDALEAKLNGLETMITALVERLDKAGSAPARATGGQPLATEDVRPPRAEDLEGYVRDLPGAGPLTATLETSMGKIRCTLLADQAPMTVANFVGLARGLKAWRHPETGEVTRKPLYDGVVFHRVIPDFMIQGGDPLGRGNGGPGYRFDDEIAPTARHDGAGVLSMANAGAGTNGSQFFITDKATPHLDGRHTVFGRCRDVAVIKKIARVKRTDADRPEKDVVIQRITIARQ